MIYHAKFMSHRKNVLLAIALCISIYHVHAQEIPDDKGSRKILDTLTYETQSGLPIAASKIYFSDSKFTFSGFGEANYINYLGPKNRESNDVELYMTNLYRFVGYAAWRPRPWLVLYAELFAELIRDGKNEQHFEYMPEAFADFLISEKFNVRVGSHQVQIGYLNNNDEPIMFYTVNRPEVERVIIPSTWIDMGIMTYGKFNNDLKWSLSAYQALDSRNFNAGTWIRRGRDNTLRANFNNLLLNSQLIYSGIKNTEISASGVWTQAGNKEELPDLNQPNAKANTFLLSSYARHNVGNWTFMFLGAYGSMGDTDFIYQLTELGDAGVAQLMGSQVYGYYFEAGYNILSLFKSGISKERNNFFIRHQETKLPVFVRYERLDTHAAVHPELAHLPYSQTDLHTVTLGANFNPRRSIVFKANYQFRWNKAPLTTGEYEGNRFEIGTGFIF